MEMDLQDFRYGFVRICGFAGICDIWKWISEVLHGTHKTLKMDSFEIHRDSQGICGYSQDSKWICEDLQGIHKDLGN